MKQNATLDTSFWVHAVVANLVVHMIDEFDLFVTPAVLSELPDTYSSGKRLRDLVDKGEIHVRAPSRESIKQFGPGERSAINLAAESEWILLMDDLRAVRTAEAMGLTPISTPAYITSLVGRSLLTRSQAMATLGLLLARATLSRQLIELAVEQIIATGKE